MKKKSNILVLQELERLSGKKPVEIARALGISKQLYNYRKQNNAYEPMDRARFERVFDISESIIRKVEQEAFL